MDDEGRKVPGRPAEGGAATQGETSCVFSVEHRSSTFYFDDLYCPKPACRCGEVVLKFFGETVNPVGQAVLSHAFDATLTLRGKLSMNEIHQPDNPGETRAREIVKSLREQDPDLLKTLRERQQIVKHIATQSLAIASPLAAMRKIGRNAPCPCMSGKKYKNCCGG